MQLTEVLEKLGENSFGQMLHTVSIGKLKTYQLYEGFKAAAHLHKLNVESMRKATPRFWARIHEGDEEFAKNLGQVVLVSNLDMITAVLDFLKMPHEGGFFPKELDPAPYLTEGWADRVFENFKGVFPESVLLFYINHLSWELTSATEPYLPQAAQRG